MKGSAHRLTLDPGQRERGCRKDRVKESESTAAIFFLCPSIAIRFVVSHLCYRCNLWQVLVVIDNDRIRRELEMFSDEELTEILHDRDEEKWRPEVYDIVAAILESRGISTRELFAQVPQIPEDEAALKMEACPGGLITIAEYFNPLDAHADKLALEQAGLRAWVTDDNPSASEGIIAKLQVGPGDWSKAMEILEAPPVAESDLPPEFAAPKCPRCGSAEIEEGEEDAVVMDSDSSALSASLRKAQLCRCTSCGHSWSL